MVDGGRWHDHRTLYHSRYRLQPECLPPPLAAAPPPTTGRLTNKLKVLNLGYTQVTNAGCATLAAALNSGALPALETLYLHGIPASAAAQAAVYAARASLKK